MPVGDFNIDSNLVLNGLSLTILLVITDVDFSIHIYTSWYMRGEEDCSRPFVYTDLFIASMVVLVFVDNLPLMHLNWEDVGLCSYLLIGFYYTDSKNDTAAVRAFVMACVGGVFLAFALFVLHNELGTPSFREMVELTPARSADGSNMLTRVTLVLLDSTVGKSAQLLLQTWLTDTMVGPTPVSALIHAVTMVTVGVYLTARTHGLSLMTLGVSYPAGIVEAVTLLLVGFTALAQTGIKRVLAYSIMSQIDYMFLMPDVQAWDAATFHLAIHALFKALLFLASGSVILICYYEQNVFKIGDLRKPTPLVHLCFPVGGAAPLALPLVTAGFFSRDKVLAGAMANGYINPMVTGLVGAFITLLYTFRVISIAFHGKEQVHAHAVKGVAHSPPPIVLLILSTFVGALIVPPLQDVLPQTTELMHNSMLTLEVTSSTVMVVGILPVAWLRLGKRTLVTSIANSAPGRLLGTWWYNAWGFDWLYDKALVKPFLGIAWLLRRNPLNSMMNILAVLPRFADRGLLLSENDYLRWYVTSMNIGVVVVLALLMTLR